jgi:2-methylcitrate dehydratase PrpD
VTACLLARDGVRGFEQPFEGQAGFFRLFANGQFDADVLRAGLGERFWIEQLSFKAWPCCRGTHAFIEAAAALRNTDGFDTADIAQIELAGANVHRMLAEPILQKRAPRTLIDAKFSLPFTVALALQGDPINLGSFTPAALVDPTTLALASMCRFEVTERFATNAVGGGVTIHTTDGRKLCGAIDTAAGSPERPLSRAQLVAKFMDCTGHAAMPLDRAAAADLARRLLSLEAELDAGALLRRASPVVQAGVV